MTNNKGWLSLLPDFICIEAVVGACCLRIEVEFLLSCGVRAGTLYAGDFPLQGFNRFLQLVVERGGLPGLWPPVGTVNCIEVAVDERPRWRWAGYGLRVCPFSFNLRVKLYDLWLPGMLSPRPKLHELGGGNAVPLTIWRGLDGVT